MSQVLQEMTWNTSNHQQYFTSIYFILLQFTTCNEPASSHFLLPNNVWRYPWFSTFLHIPSSIRYFHTLAHIWKNSVTKNIFIDMFHDSNMRSSMFKVVETNRMVTTCQCQWKHNYINKMYNNRWIITIVRSIQQNEGFYCLSKILGDNLCNKSNHYAK